MDEFASGIRIQAESLLCQLFQQEPTVGIDPIVELIGMLLSDEAGSAINDSSLTSDQWLDWNELALMQPSLLAQAINQVLERERIGPPHSLVEQKRWAEWLVLSTLDQMTTG